VVRLWVIQHLWKMPRKNFLSMSGFMDMAAAMPAAVTDSPSVWIVSPFGRKYMMPKNNSIAPPKWPGLSIFHPHLE